MEATLETKTETIFEFVHGLRGSLRVSFEERNVGRLVARSSENPTLAKCWFVIRVKMPVARWQQERP
jgi:hypothetical protein